MTRRDDILVELGLAPSWRVRRPAISGSDATEVHDAATAVLEPDAVATPLQQALPDAPLSLDQRRAYIATLDWNALQADIAACTACGLCRTRNKVVPGVGDQRAEWLFIGEAPGADEDAQGEPFVGQAGKLLDSMLAAIGIRRGQAVYIANVLKCRPPGNRVPEPLEVESCKPYLDRQIELIAPKLIVALGKSAATTLLGVESSIASLRGRIHRYGNLPLLVTYHPAYLLRNLPDKAKAWEDLLLARRTVGAADATSIRR